MHKHKDRASYSSNKDLCITQGKMLGDSDLQTQKKEKELTVRATYLRDRIGCDIIVDIHGGAWQLSAFHGEMKRVSKVL